MALPAAASVLSSGLGAYPTVYYDRVAVKSLFSNLFLYPGLDLKQMPDRAGVVMQIFTYTPYTANTTPQTEGTPGTGQTLTQVTGSITLSQFVDYVSFSDKVVLTAISDTVAEGAEQLAYRGALTVDTIISTTIDTEANGDTTTLINIADGSYMTAAKSRQAAQSIRAANGKPKDNGLFYGVINSLVAFDLINDSSAGGFIDLMKYTDANAPKLQSGIQNNRIGSVGGVEWFESNALPTQTHWQSSANTAYFNYVLGKDAVFGSSLGKTALGQKNFSVMTSRFAPGTQSQDPAGVITAAASYNFFFGCSTRPGTVNTFRRIAAESSIA